MIKDLSTLFHLRNVITMQQPQVPLNCQSLTQEVQQQPHQQIYTVGCLFQPPDTTHRSASATGLPDLCCHGYNNKHAVKVEELSLIWLGLGKDHSLG